MFKRLELLALIVFALILFISFLTYADGNDGVSLVPSKIDLDLKPGESKSVDLTLYNRTGHTDIVEIRLKDYIVDGKVIKYVPDSKSELLKWAKLSYKGTILPNKAQRKLRLDINIPKDASYGKYKAILSVKFKDISNARKQFAVDSEIAVAIEVDVREEKVSSITEQYVVNWANYLSVQGTDILIRHSKDGISVANRPESLPIFRYFVLKGI